MTERSTVAVPADRLHRFGVADREAQMPHGDDRCLHCPRSFFEANDWEMLMWGDFWCVYDKDQRALIAAPESASLAEIDDPGSAATLRGPARPTEEVRQ